MSLTSLFLTLFLIWAVLHGIDYLSKGQEGSLLPTLSSRLSRRRNLLRHPIDVKTQVALDWFHLRVTTTAWNELHDYLSAYFSKKRNQRITRVSKRFYDVGVAFGVLGMLMAFGGLFFATGYSLWTLIHAFPTFSEPSAILGRRDLDVRGDAGENAMPFNPTITPIIPGVTVPLSHLPIIMTSVFLSQLVHEVGHAIAAAVESIPLSASGAAFTVLFPSAFVTFPSSCLKALHSRAHSRIISAGPFFNLILWCSLLILGKTGLGEFITTCGYQNISEMGRIIVNVDPISPLHGHLVPISTVVTKLDDTNLGIEDDIWGSFLNSSPNVTGLGWCVNRTSTESTDQCCLTPHKGSIAGDVCFISVDVPDGIQSCINPVPLLTNTRSGLRCSTSSQCLGGAACLEPSPEAQLLRLTTRTVDSNQESVIIWSGPRADIWQHVEVGEWVPRWRFTTLGVLYLWKEFWRYLVMSTLSLYIFNLLPAPFLDGAKLFRCLVTSLFEWNPVPIDLENLERSDESSPRRRNLAKIDKIASTLTVILLLLYAITGILTIL